jgi:hypothetical protein
MGYDDRDLARTDAELDEIMGAVPAPKPAAGRKGKSKAKAGRPARTAGGGGLR